MYQAEYNHVLVQNIFYSNELINEKHLLRPHSFVVLIFSIMYLSFLTNETHYHVLDQKGCKFVIKDQIKRT